MRTIEPLLRRTYQAAAELRRASDRQVKAALKTLAASLDAQTAYLLRANAKDLRRQDPSNSRNDRLILNGERIRSIARSIRQVSGLPDPSGKLLEKRVLPNGL